VDRRGAITRGLAPPLDGPRARVEGDREEQVALVRGEEDPLAAHDRRRVAGRKARLPDDVGPRPELRGKGRDVSDPHAVRPPEARPVLRVGGDHGHQDDPGQGWSSHDSGEPVDSYWAGAGGEMAALLG